MLIVDRDNRHLYELFDLAWDGTRWTAGSGAFFDLAGNDRRPDGWTSADAAGLAILPGLVRYDEVYGPGEITHAFRVTVRATNNFYVWPASHVAGSNTSALPMGARLRLKAAKDLSGFPPETQKIFRAMKKYGLIVADNGSDMYISGAFDPRWDNDILNPAFRGLTAADFEVIELGWRGTTGPTPPCAPGAPTDLWSSVNGYAVSLGWTPPPGAVLGHLARRGLRARSRPTSDRCRLAAPAAAFAATAPAGRYYVRVRAAAACGRARPRTRWCSTCRRAARCPPRPARCRSRSPAAPWHWPGAPASSAAAYMLEAGNGPGAANILNADVGAAPQHRRPRAAGHLLRPGARPQLMRAVGPAVERDPGRGSLTSR